MRSKRIFWKIWRRLFPPEVLRGKRVVGEAPPRCRRTRTGDARGVVTLEPVTGLASVWSDLDRLWPDLFGALIHPGHGLFIKINLNSADPYPASTCPRMLAELLRFLHDRGHRRIEVGDCSGFGALPTLRVAKKTGILDALAGRARFLDFDRTDWVTIALPGPYLQSATVPKAVLEADRIISLANLKTHRLADVSFGLKLAVGYLHPLERYALHQDHLQEKAVEINLAVPADLTLIDGREAFVSGGPDRGERAAGAVVLAGTDPVAVDAEAYRRLYRLQCEQGCGRNVPADPFATRQLRHAREIGLSAAAEVAGKDSNRCGFS